MISKLEKCFSRFIWNDRKPKIALKSLQNTKEAGGLNLVDLHKKDMSIKISWIGILKDEKSMSTIVYSMINENIGELIWSCNFSPKDAKEITKNNFWSDVLQSWATYNYKTAEEIQDNNQIIWYNSCIKIGEKWYGGKNNIKRG